jgi:hypothetical protein
MKTATIPEPGSTPPVPAVADGDLYEIINGQRVVLPPMGILAVWIATQVVGHLAPFVRTRNVGRGLGGERNHQGLGNRLIDGGVEVGRRTGAVHWRERFGGLLRDCYRPAA